MRRWELWEWFVMKTEPSWMELVLILKRFRRKWVYLWKIQGKICFYNWQIQKEICHLEDGPHPPCWHPDLGRPRLQNCDKWIIVTQSIILCDTSLKCTKTDIKKVVVNRIKSITHITFHLFLYISLKSMRLMIFI